MKLNLNFVLENPELLGINKDAEITDDALHCGKILATCLAKATESENPVKFLDWALDLYKKKEINVDKSDLEMLRKFVKGHQQMFVFAKGQILNKINEALDSDKKEKSE